MNPERVYHVVLTVVSREYIGSYDHGVMACRLSASRPGSVNVKISLSRSQYVLSQAAAVSSDGDNLHSVSLSGNSGQTSGGAITFWSEARVGHSKGVLFCDECIGYIVPSSY